jgi:hypothetical protein
MAQTQQPRATCSAEKPSTVAQLIHRLLITGDALVAPKGLKGSMALIRIHVAAVTQYRRSAIGLVHGALPQGQTEERVDGPALTS